MLGMTRARTASYGLGNPPPLDRWIDAVLMLFAILVQGVVTTFGMRRCGRERDWHTRSDALALPQTKLDIQIKEQDTSLEAYPLARVPGAGRDPVSARSALPTHTPISIAPGATLATCHPGSAQRYPGPIAQSVPAPRWVPALRFAAAGMTFVRANPT